MALATKLDAWRRDLIDMSRNNNLLYYRSSGRGAGVHLDVEDANMFFAKMTRGGRAATYVADRVVPPVESEEIERRIGRLHARARVDLNDRGLNTLYLVFGMLEWRETAASDDVIHSPLVMVPVTLTRPGIWSPYQIQRLVDDDVEINPTLREKLAHDFKLRLPTYDELGSGGMGDGAQEAPSTVQARKSQVSLPDVLDAIRMRLPEGVMWKALPEVHLGRFSFQKLVMYEDLGQHEVEVFGHPLLRMLGGERTAEREPAGVVAAADLDRRVNPRSTLQVLDADSSQEEAIVAAKAGASFVLQGPPGTGKSQTIANIIAESLGQGRRVLFVSEKMAALDVVRQRLQEAGLSDFCLDLHDPRADKRPFIQSIQESVEDAHRQYTRHGEQDWERQSEALAETRQALNAYVRELHRQRFGLRISTFEAYGRFARLEGTPDGRFAVANVQTVSESDLRAMRAALDDLRNSAEVLDHYGTYPWRETLAHRFTLELAGDIRAHFGRLGANLVACDRLLTEIRTTLEDRETGRSFEQARATARKAALVVDSPLPPRHWIDAGEPARIRGTVVEAMARNESYWTRRHRIGPYFERSLLDLDQDAILVALTHGSAWAVERVAAPLNFARDFCVERRADLGRVIDAACQVLDDMLAAARDVAESCGLESPQTISEIRHLDQLTKCLLSTPRPPVEWLDQSQFPTIRAKMRETRDAYKAVAEINAKLAPAYLPGYFDAGIVDIAHRFRALYETPLRFVRPQYYADVRRLRAFEKPAHQRTHKELAEDLYQAEKLLETRQWIDEHKSGITPLFGLMFAQEQTDWPRVDAAIAWAEELHGHMRTTGTSPKVVAIACGPIQRQAAVRAGGQRLGRTWAEWERLKTELSGYVNGASLGNDGRDVEESPILELRGALERMRAELRAFWHALDQIGAHRVVRELSGPVDTSGTAEPARSWADLCDDVRAARDARAYEDWLREHHDALSRDFGAWFKGPRTDWMRIAAAVTWAERCAIEFADNFRPKLRAELVCAGADSAGRDALRAAWEALSSSLATVDEELLASDRYLPRDALFPKGAIQADVPLTALGDRVSFLLENLPALEKWLVCQERLQRCKDVGLGRVVEGSLGHSPFPRDIGDIFERRFYAQWLDEVRRLTPALATFRGETHEQLRGRFARLDEEHLRLARERLAGQLRERRGRALSQDRLAQDTRLKNAVADLKREALLKRHRSIRQIVRKVGPALMEVRPCWMMSPLSVSQFVESGERLFDLVVFDEASQVCAEDAISAILRGKQLVVVGDSKQLPPTKFFAKTLADGDVEDEEEERGGAVSPDEQQRVAVPRVESILAECLAAGLTPRSLTWHYRSRHESLIAFSNHHFYRDSLITFPSPDAKHAAGVRYEYVAKAIYDAGRTRTNRVEAERVVDLIFEHVREHGDQTLGVVALSEAQQQAIGEALKERFKGQVELRAWEDVLDEDDPGGFFIKNLESVQGDERDVIILSTGYGRDRDGRLAHRFGAVNLEGGERRLNVAVTRARYQLVVVSSIHASELRADMAGAGARTLRDYLDYAEHGTETLRTQVAVGEATGATRTEDRFDSPFEQAVCEALRERGLEVDTQVGCSGFRIDLAIRDPGHVGGYVLGIECDGRTYHSSHTARDRDRLRQRHLERMGWSIHRIWSSDWVSDSRREVSKVLDKFAELRAVPGIAQVGERDSIGMANLRSESS